MKRLIFTPLLLIFLISCSNQKNKIFSGEWVSYEEINNKEYPDLYAKVDFKFIDCIKNICQYKFRIKYTDALPPYKGFRKTDIKQSVNGQVTQTL